MNEDENGEFNLNVDLFLQDKITKCEDDETPCLNGATCTGEGDDLKCNCAPGYGGYYCESKRMYTRCHIC